MAFPSPSLFPSDSVFPSAFSAPPPPPPSVGGLEQLTLDDIELNDGNPWTVMRDPATIEWTPPKKKLNWIDSPLSDGAALAGAEDHYENAEIVLTLGLARQTSKDRALQLLHTLTQKLQQARRTPGGLSLTWTPSGSSSSLTYYVVEAEYEEFDIQRTDGWFTNAPTFRIHLYLRPFGYGSEEQIQLGYSDQFLYNSVAGGPWRVDNTPQEVGALGGYLACTGTTQPKHLYLPYTAEDIQVAMRIGVNPDPLNPGFGLGGLLLKRTAGFTHLAVMIDEVNNKLQIRKYVTGNATVLAGADFTPIDGNFYWLVGTITDNTVFAGIYDDGTIDVGDPSVSVTHDLTDSADDAAFGTGVRGQAGVHLVPTSTGGVVVDQFRLGGMTDVTSGEPVACVDLLGIGGDVDAEARTVVTEASTQSRSSYEWGLESEQYDPTLTWPYVLDSDALVVTGFNGTKTTVGGNVFDPFVSASGNTNVITSGGLSSTTPVTVCATGSLRHVGAYKVKARVSNAIPNSSLRLRLAWRAGEGSYTTNVYTEDVPTGGFFEVDLGQVNIVQTGLANQTWNGLVQAYATSGTGLLVVDYLMLIPLEGWGTARNPSRPVVADTFSAVDHFNRGNGALGNLDTGGTWTTQVGTGLAILSNSAQRTATGDAIGTGNKVTAGTTNYAGVQVQADAYIAGTGGGGFSIAEPTGVVRQGVLTRYVDASNWAALVRTNVQIPGGGGGGPSATQKTRLQMFKCIAGVVSSLGTKDFNDTPTVNKTLLVNIDINGFWTAYIYNQGAKQPNRPTLQGQDAVFTAGGTLATGKIGLYDAYSGATPSVNRNYDSFIAFVQPLDSVLFSAKHLEVRSDRTIRESSTGGSYGKVPRYFGDRFFLPAAGSDQNTCRLAWKARRSDVDGGAPDTSAPGSDATTLSIFATPRYLLPTGG